MQGGRYSNESLALLKLGQLFRRQLGEHLLAAPQIAPAMAPIVSTSPPTDAMKVSISMKGD